MATVAIVFAPSEPFANLAAAGVELTERQVRQARHAGAARIYVIGGHRNYGSNAVNLDATTMLERRLDDGDHVLVLASGLVADDQLIEAVTAAVAAFPHEAALVVATWPAAMRRGVERIDAQCFAAGIAVYPAAMVRRTVLQLGDWDLASTLLRAALAETACLQLDLSTLSSSVAATGSSPVYAVVTSAGEALSATAAVLAATVRPRPDAVARYLHAPIERSLLQPIASTRITPQAITVTCGAIGVAATVAFTFGWLWTGLVLALLFGPLQALGRRLAEARVIRLRWQRWTISTAIIGYSWWLALAVALALARGNGGPLAVAALLLTVQITAASETRFAQRLDASNAGPGAAIDRTAALLAANRDSLTLLLVPFAFAGQWYAGLIALAGYGVASFAVTHARFLARLSEQR